MGEKFDMMKAIQAATLPVGVFTLADIPVGVSISDYFCKIPAQKFSGNEESEVYYQMNCSYFAKITLMTVLHFNITERKKEEIYVFNRWWNL